MSAVLVRSQHCVRHDYVTAGSPNLRLICAVLHVKLLAGLSVAGAAIIEITVRAASASASPVGDTREDLFSVCYCTIVCTTILLIHFAVVVQCKYIAHYIGLASPSNLPPIQPV